MSKIKDINVGDIVYYSDFASYSKDNKPKTVEFVGFLRDMPQEMWGSREEFQEALNCTWLRERKIVQFKESHCWMFLDGVTKEPPTLPEDLFLDLAKKLGYYISYLKDDKYIVSYKQSYSYYVIYDLVTKMCKLEQPSWNEYNTKSVEVCHNILGFLRTIHTLEEDFNQHKPHPCNFTEKLIQYGFKRKTFDRLTYKAITIYKAENDDKFALADSKDYKKISCHIHSLHDLFWLVKFLDNLDNDNNYFKGHEIVTETLEQTGEGSLNE